VEAGGFVSCPSSMLLDYIYLLDGISDKREAEHFKILLALHSGTPVHRAAKDLHTRLWDSLIATLSQ
jgi:hypothetical protein